MVEREGFEPSRNWPTSGLRPGALPHGRPLSRNGLAGRIRTCGLLVPNEARWPICATASLNLVEKAGIKPASFACKAIALSTELHPRWYSRPDLNRHTRLEGPRS